MPHLDTEKMRDGFIKYHLRDLTFKGEPFYTVLHHFTEADKNLIHDHPFGFHSHVLRGGYIERIYTVLENGLWSCRQEYRAQGTSHKVEATDIHEIISLPEGECWTQIVLEPKIREWRFWQFDEHGSRSRAWYEEDFEAVQILEHEKAEKV